MIAEAMSIYTKRWENICLLELTRSKVLYRSSEDEETGKEELLCELCKIICLRRNWLAAMRTEVNVVMKPVDYGNEK